MIATAWVKLAAGRDGSPPYPIATGGGTADLDLQARILIIEDELMIAWMVQSLLEDMGFSDIDIAGDSRAALAAAADAPPSLIISDINLGGGADGIETVRQIAGTSSVPVLFVSAYADADARLRMAEHLPASALLRKPVEPDVLARAVQAMLTGRRSTH